MLQKNLYEVIKRQIIQNASENLDELIPDFFEGILWEESRRYIACFCEENDSSLMWGHYANGHRGLCLEYDFTSTEPTEYHITEPVKEYLAHLMEQPVCVCGEPMTDSHKEKIQTFIHDHLVTDDAVLVEKERRALFNACAQYQRHGFQTRAAYFSLSEEIWKKEKERSSKKEEFEHLRKDIGSFNEEAGERIIQDIANMEAKKQEAETRRTRTQVLLEQDQEKLARLEERLAELSQLDKEGALCQKKLENTSALEKIFSVYRNRLLEEKRAFVEKYATEVFLQITNAPQKYKGIKIAKDYSLLLELTNGETYQIEPGRTLNPSIGQSMTGG